MEMDGDWQRKGKNDFNYKYNGKEIHQDFEWGLYNYGARYYDPSIGRFTTVDPLADALNNNSLGTYSYVRNNPINTIDPDGRNGILLGSGTKEDPYKVKANYYVVKGTLSEDEMNELQAAIDEYNESDGDVLFELSLSVVETKAKANSKIFGEDMFEDENGEQRSFGNLVKSDGGDNLDNMGSATGASIAVSRDGVNHLKEAGGLSGGQTNKVRKAVWIHEIAHNLGLVHEDDAQSMTQIDLELKKNTIGGKVTPFLSLPKLDSQTAKLILERVLGGNTGSMGVFKAK